MGHESGFITPPQHAGSRNDYHDLQPVSETQLSLLTMAVREGRRWMLKSLPQQLQDSAMHQALQQKEYDILCRLSHPAIVSVVEMADVPTLGRCIVMEYVDGVTLDALRADTKTRRHLAHQLAEAVAYIHAHQVVHRDLKPTNIMVTHNGRNIKIIDFGLADTDAHTILKQPAGTPGYMSAEQQAESRPDVRNDIYSLGIILRNMNLGWTYGRAIKRMTCPMEHRIPNMFEVQRQLGKAHHRKVRLMAVVLLALLIGISTAIFISLLHSDKEHLHQPVLTRDTSDTIHAVSSNDEVIPKGVQLDSDVSLIADAPQMPLPHTTPKPPEQVATNQVTPSKAENGRDATEKIGTTAPTPTNRTTPNTSDTMTQKGFDAIDNYMQREHFQAIADTASCNETYRKLFVICAGAKNVVMAICNEVSDYQKRAQLDVILSDYTNSIYWTPFTKSHPNLTFPE